VKTSYYRLAGLTLAVSVPTPALASLLNDVLSYKGAQPTSEEAADLRVTYRIGGAMPGLAPPSETRRVARHAESRITVTFDEETGVYWLMQEPKGDLRGAAMARVDPAERQAEGVLGADAARGRAFDARAFYFTTISLVLLLAEQDRFVLHAAALERDGRSVLFSGPSGQGKTTLTLNLLRAGWSLVTDDSVLLSETNGGVRATTFRRELNLSPDGVRLVPALGARTWPPPLGLRDKWRVDPDVLFAGRSKPETMPRRLLFPERVAEGPSRLAPVSRVEAFQRLIRQSALGLVQDATCRIRYAAVLQKLVQRTEPVRLLSGPDLFDAPERLDALIGEDGPVGRRSPG
jgi:hypothetical protein